MGERVKFSDSADFCLFDYFAERICLAGKSCKKIVRHKLEEHRSRARELCKIALPGFDSVCERVSALGIPVEYVYVLDVILGFLEIIEVFLDRAEFEGLPVHSELVGIYVIHKHQRVLEPLSEGVDVALKTELDVFALRHIRRTPARIHKALYLR